ncbi:MAG: hypothetical protein AAF196_01515 [Planctomycetota bacterium]
MSSDPDLNLDEIERSLRDALAELETALHDCTDVEHGPTDEVRALGRFDLGVATLEGLVKRLELVLEDDEGPRRVDFNELLRTALDRSVVDLRVPVQFDMALGHDPVIVEIERALHAAVLLEKAIAMVLRAVEAGDRLVVELRSEGEHAVLSLTIEGGQRSGLRRMDAESRRATLVEVAADLGAVFEADDRSLTLRFPKTLDRSPEGA